MDFTNFALSLEQDFLDQSKVVEMMSQNFFLEQKFTKKNQALDILS